LFIGGAIRRVVKALMFWAESIRPVDYLWTTKFLERLYDAFCVLPDGQYVRLFAAATVVLQREVHLSNGDLRGKRNVHVYRMQGIRVDSEGRALSPRVNEEFIIDPEADVIVPMGSGSFEVVQGDGQITMLTMSPHFFAINKTGESTPPLLELLFPKNQRIKEEKEGKGADGDAGEDDDYASKEAA
jgi:hypothetical protein